MTREHKPMEQRLMSKVEKESGTGCWKWTGTKLHDKPHGSYGMIRVGGRSGKMKRAHRVSYEHFVGKISEGLSIDHKCHNTLCINPAHLEAVTHKENMRRRKDSNLSHCKRGHLYTEKTTHINVRGRRECRTCRNLASLASYYKKKAS